MATTIDFALMAGSSYRSNRDPNNRFPIPIGWDEVPGSYRNLPSGFEAITFTTSTEIVISFAGTGPGWGDWLNGNTPLALGILGQQLEEAAQYYLQIKAQNPDANITLTGHSLGGGLASLIAVMFDENAVTFDQAPFNKSALFFSTTNPDTGEVTTTSVALALRQYLTGGPYEGMLTKLDAYITANTNNPDSIAADTVAGRADNVTNINVQGEILSGLLFNRIGTQTDLLSSHANVSAIDLHSITLLTAFLQSGDTSTSTQSNKTLGQVTFKLVDLLKMIFDKNLYYNDPNNLSPDARENLLERLVKHEEGVRDSVQADGMVTRFTADLWKLAQDGGMTITDSNSTDAALNKVSKTLIAFAMQMYYEDTANATDATKQLFTDLSTTGTGSNGITFDIADVSEDIKAAIDANKNIDLTKAKGYQEFFSKYINDIANFTIEEIQLIQNLLPTMRDWYVQAGIGGMIATETLNRGAFMLGGASNDNLTGGSKADLLVGNAGDDTLKGGEGNDIILGGSGNDTYLYSTGDGFDTILDSDKRGSIEFDGYTLAGGDQYGDNRVHKDANNHIYVQVDANTLIIDGNIMVKNYTDGSNTLGIAMSGPVAEPALPNTTRDIKGDLEPIDFDPATDGVQTEKDDLGNTKTNPNIASNDRSETLYDSTGNDHIMAGGGINIIYATRGGDDLIEGGSNYDYVQAGSGNDVIIGGADDDVLAGGEGDVLDGGEGDDRIYADTKVTVEQGIMNGNTQTGRGVRGDWLAGGLGEDILIGSIDNDVLTGGDGNDLLIGGAGDDDIMGDYDMVPQGNDWYVITNGNTREFHYLAWEDIVRPIGIPGNDVIYAGKGNDNAWAGQGNDVIFGEDGNDILLGNGGDDILIGGEGNDLLLGDGNDFKETVETGKGNDYLDGGAGDDILYGGDGNDILIGGSGTNYLHGGAGNDTYLINSNDGINYINDNFGGSEHNTIRFGVGIDQNAIRLGLGSLKLDLGNGNTIHIENFNSQDVYNSVGINSFEFADGSTLTSSQLLARGFDLEGTVADDAIAGTNITDRMNGLDGNDIMTGGDGNDVMNGGAGNDHVQGDAGDDVIDGGEGDDQLLGLDGNDSLLGGGGNDELQGNSGDDVLDGGAGNDTLFGQAGFDILDGGLGDDVLLGNAGDDVYQFSLGGGQDVIWEEGDSAGDVLRFGTGITSTDIIVFQSEADLVLSHINGVDQVTIANWYVSSTYQLKQFEFADGMIWNGVDTGNLRHLGGTSGNDVIYGTTQSETLYGLAGNDTIYGNGGSDIFVGGKGNDFLVGNVNTADTFVFALGDGADIIQANYQLDTLRFNADIQNTDISAERVGSDLVLRHQNGTDSVTIQSWYASTNYQLKNVMFASNNTVWDASTLNQMGINIDNNYTLNIGDSIKTIDDWGGTDTLTIGSEILDSNIVISRLGQDLQVAHTNGVDKVIIKDWFNDITKQIESILFTSSGTQISKAQINSQYVNITGTSSNDILRGGDAYGETILGLSGDDTIYGGGGNDYIDGGSGTNELYGQDGDDTLVGGASGSVGGVTRSYGGNGNDTYIFNAGNDLRIFEAGGSDDRINMIEGIQVTDLVFQTSGYNLRIFSPIIYADIVISNQFLDSSYTVDRLVLADGTILGLRDVQNGYGGVVNGTAEDSILVSQSSDDILNGGDGNDYLVGSSGNNTLNGGNGNDILNGSFGSDTLNGGTGNDIYFVDDRNDVVTEQLNEGIDTVHSTLAYTLGNNVENLTLIGTSSVNGTGNALDNIFRGNSASNTFTGGAGNDIYYLSTGDSAVEAVGGGTDVVYTDVTYTLGTNIENGFIIGTGAVNLTGNALANNITGNAADNILNGGTGSDTLIGGLGDDTYIIDVATDVVLENENEGSDTIQVGYATTSAITLKAGSGQFTNIENITVTGTGLYNLTGDAANNTLIGNASANVLTGNAGNDILNGLAGNDSMSGGLGDDTYTIDVLTDTITENLNEGTDLINVAINTRGGTYTLGNHIENGTLTNTVAYTLTGNALDNILNGNSAANTLNGGDGNDVLDGMAGSDNMSGGLGNDTYFVDVTGDVVTEAVGAGIDSVNVGIATSGGTYTLGANIENGKLTNTVAFNITGNILNNYLMGNIANNTLTDTAGGNDILQGLAGIDTFNDTVGNNLFDGGIDNDIMTGGSGRDLFIGGLGVDTITSGTGYDVIAFNKGDGQDTINASTGADNTLSLGGNFAYSDLSLTKSTNDLILKMGATEQITLKDWYLGTTNKSVVNLQVIAEAMQGFSLGSADDLRNNKIENFNFAGIVSQFDAAGATANWQLTDARLTAHLQAGSDSAAIGGDLAYQYGMNSNLTGMGLSNAQSVIAAASFGQTAQTLNNPSVWQAEVVKLA